MTNEQILDLWLAYDADDIEVREQLAIWLAEFGPYGAGAAAGLMRPEPRVPIYPARRRITA